MIKQQAEFDCVLVSIANATGKDYYEIFPEEFRRVVQEKKGCYSGEITQAFEYAGLTKDVDYKSLYVRHADEAVVRSFLWKRKALIQAVSLNHEGSEHVMFWDGQELHDPSNKQVYKYLSSVYPTYVWIFNEVIIAGD